MKILIFGGTHGNEWTGVMVVKHYAEHFKKKYPKLDLHFVHANPEAFALNRRFKDEDLNRAFQFLSEDRPSSYEHARAKELKRLIDEGPCFVIDLHTTTANMGATVIVSRETKRNFHLCRELTLRHEDCRVILSPDPGRKYLASQVDSGLMIEVGPIANGVVNAETLEHTLKLLDTLFSTLEKNEVKDGTLEAYEETQDVHYPQDDSGAITAFVHPSLQGKDFKPLRGSYSAFKSFSGETITLKTAEELYPIFINEAAYYPTKLAFTLCRRMLKNF